MAVIQLPGLNALVDQFAASGNFEILAFPSNQFGLQDWPTDAELMPVLKNVRPGGGFVPKYKYASKLEVNGENEDALFTFIKSSCPGTVDRIGDQSMMFWNPVSRNDLSWNFEKILIDKKGKPRFRHHPTQLPSAMADQIKILLDEKVEVEQPLKHVIKERKNGKEIQTGVKSKTSGKNQRELLKQRAANFSKMSRMRIMKNIVKSMGTIHSRDKKQNK